MSTCIEILPIFALQPNYIEGAFVDGILQGRAFLRWPKFHAEVIVSNGTVDGAFRIEEGSRWTFGVMKSGRVSGGCTIVDQTSVSNLFMTFQANLYIRVDQKL